MGDPTSWPGLPLLTIFCYQLATGRKAGIRTCGDDAMMQMTEAQSLVHTALLTSLGSGISPSKDYFSKEFCLYTEIIFKNGDVVPVCPVSSLIGPPGGSKGETTWFNSATSFQTQATLFGFSKRKIIKYEKCSRFMSSWKIANQLQIPVNLPEYSGGINLMCKVGNVHRNMLDRVGTFLSNLKLKDLQIGSALSIIPSFKYTNIFIEEAREKAFELFLPLSDTITSPITLKEVIGLCSSGATTLTLLNGQQPKQPSQISIEVYADKLRKKLIGVKGIYHATPKKFLADLNSKRNRYLHLTKDEIKDLSMNFLGFTPIGESFPLEIQLADPHHNQEIILI